jgi:hypothetical protein
VGAHRRDLKDEFLHQADWRYQKASEYPDDERSAKAAGMLARLAATVDTCPDEVIDTYASLLDDPSAVEIWSAMINRIGFGYSPSLAEEYLRGFISDQTGGRW